MDSRCSLCSCWDVSRAICSSSSGSEETEWLCVRDNVALEGLLRVPFECLLRVPFEDFTGVGPFEASIGVVLLDFLTASSEWLEREDFALNLVEISDPATSDPEVDPSSDADSVSYSEPDSDADWSLLSGSVGGSDPDSVSALDERLLDMYCAGDRDLEGS